MAIIPTYTKTHCPYCGQSQEEQSRYVYRVVFLNHETSLEAKGERKVVEIYCAKCHTTLGLYPIWD